MQTNPAVEQSKIIRWSESPWNPSGRYLYLLISVRKKILYQSEKEDF